MQMAVRLSKQRLASWLSVVSLGVTVRMHGMFAISSRIIVERIDGYLLRQELQRRIRELESLLRGSV